MMKHWRRPGDGKDTLKGITMQFARGPTIQKTALLAHRRPWWRPMPKYNCVRRHLQRYEVDDSLIVHMNAGVVSESMPG